MIRYLRNTCILLVLILIIYTPVQAKKMYVKQDTYAYEQKSMMSVRTLKLKQYDTIYGKISVNKKWFLINKNGRVSYILKSNLTTKKPYVDKDTPKNSFKSYMSYKAISNKNSKQYKLQQKAITGTYGIRMVDNRYCVALGSYYTHQIGQKVDLIMDDGTIIPCIVGDGKADIHTDSKNQKTQNGCISEFIVDISVLNKDAKRSGNISSCSKKFNQSIKKIRIWNY